MHSLQRLIRRVNKTHPGLGPMAAVNLLSAKANKTILNVSPASCGKSATTDALTATLKGDATRYTSLTLAGLKHIQTELSFAKTHMIIDDLGGEKSMWSRLATITVLANLVYGHHVHKLTQGYKIEIENFTGSASLNIQPILLQGLIESEDWISVVRDKVIRYYHLVRPLKPNRAQPSFDSAWGPPIDAISMPKYKGKLWYSLVALGLCQWSIGRTLEHITDLLKAAAAIDGRKRVDATDMRLLVKLLAPLRLERYIIKTYGFETSRDFDSNAFCILVELASHKALNIETISVDYKVSPSTTERLLKTVSEWAWVKENSPKTVMPTDFAKKVLEQSGAYQKW